MTCVSSLPPPILLPDSFLFFVGVRRIGRYHLSLSPATATNSYINIYRAIVRHRATHDISTARFPDTDSQMPPVFWLLV